MDRGAWKVTAHEVTKELDMNDLATLCSNCMQVRKQQLELDMEQQTRSK